MVDYEIIGTKTQSNKNKFESGVASSMSKILNGEHKFKILNREAPVLGVTMKDNNGSATMGKQYPKFNLQLVFNKNFMFEIFFVLPCL